MENEEFCRMLYDKLKALPYAEERNDGLLTITDFSERVRSCCNSLKEQKGQVEYITVGFDEREICKMVSVTLTKSFAGKTYLSITFRASHSVEIYFDNQAGICLQSSETKARYKVKGKPTVIIIHGPDTPYSSTRGGAYYPTTFSLLKNAPKNVAEEICKAFSPAPNVTYDFIREGFFPSVAMLKALSYHNKKEYLEKEFRLTLTKSINSYSAASAFIACRAAKYILPEQQNYLLENIIENGRWEENHGYKNREKQLVAEYIAAVIQTRLEKRCVSIDANIVDDYVQMSVDAKKPIDILAGKKEIVKRHDELACEAVKRANRKTVLKFPSTPLMYLKLPKEFQMLKTKKAYEMEGKIQYNCVYSYIDKTNSGKCVIYSAVINSECVTIEVAYNARKKKIWVKQCLKKYNAPCSKKTLDYVCDCVDKASPKAIEQFEKKNKRKRA